MRIDKFLKISRLIKRRTIANEACDAGRISVNSNIVKASYDVKPGDIIEIKMGERTIRIRLHHLRPPVVAIVKIRLNTLLQQEFYHAVLLDVGQVVFHLLRRGIFAQQH